MRAWVAVLLYLNPLQFKIKYQSQQSRFIQSTRVKPSTKIYFISSFSLHATSLIQVMEQPRALPILTMTENSCHINTEEFKSVLDKVGDHSFVLYSISGATRTGKSYALNQFIRYFEWRKQNESQDSSSPETQNWFNYPVSSTFKSQGGRERETVGIDLWSEPFFINTSHGEKVAVLLMDTQGLFDDQTTSRQNAIIFALSTFCSSVMIFNIMRLVNDDLLQQLEYFSNFAHMIFPEEDKDRLFQQLQFLVRDFELTDYDFGHHCEKNKPTDSNSNYFLDTFMPEVSSTSIHENIPEENKLVRKKILENFQDVSMYLVPDPGTKFRRQKPGSTSVEPDMDFQKSVQEFVELLTSEKHLARKSISGEIVTGLSFQKYISSLDQLSEKVEIIFKDVRTKAESAIFTEYSMATNLAISSYHEAMAKFILSNCQTGKTTEQELKSEHKKALKSAREMLSSLVKMKHDKFQLAFSSKLDEAASLLFKEFQEENEILRETAKRVLELEKLRDERAKALAQLEEESAELAKKHGHNSSIQSQQPQQLQPPPVKSSPTESAPTTHSHFTDEIGRNDRHAENHQSAGKRTSQHTYGERRTSINPRDNGTFDLRANANEFQPSSTSTFQAHSAPQQQQYLPALSQPIKQLPQSYSTTTMDHFSPLNPYNPVQTCGNISATNFNPDYGQQMQMEHQIAIAELDARVRQQQMEIEQLKMKTKTVVRKIVEQVLHRLNM